jgi:hypothetical protein
MESGYYEDDYAAPERFRGLKQYKAYSLLDFFPETKHKYVLPHLLIYVAQQKIAGESQDDLDKHLDVSSWRWSVGDPLKFVFKG